VPILSVWVLPAASTHGQPQETSFDRLRAKYGRFAHRVMNRRRIVVLSYLAISGAVIVLIGGTLGNEIFPVVDTGQFQLHLRAPAGTRIERTEQIALQTLDAIKREVGPDNVEISLGFVGTQPPNYPINSIYLWSSGSEEAVMQVQLKPGTGIRIEELKERLRRKLPQELADVRFSFEPSDIVSRVMSFGAPTPIEVAVTGQNLADSRQFAEKLRGKLAEVPTLRDLAFEQELDYPTVKVTVDRERAGVLGVTTDDVAKSVVAGTSSSRYTSANYWADPRSGIGYQVQVAIPEQQMNSLEEVKNLPIARRAGAQIDLRNVASVTDGTALGEYDRYNQQRMLTLSANISGEDLGRAARPCATGDQGGWQAARARERDRARSGAADVGNVRGPAAGAFDRDRRYRAIAGREFPIVQAVPGGRADNPRGYRRRSDRALAHANDTQHSILHGRDHGHWRRRGKRHPARDLRRTQSGRGPRAI